MNTLYEVKSSKFDTLSAAIDFSLRVYANPPTIMVSVPSEDGQGRDWSTSYAYDQTYGYTESPFDYN